MVSPGRGVLIAVVVIGWLAMGALAFFIVAALGFLGLLLVGLVLWLICVLVDLEKEGAVGHSFATNLFALQFQRRTEMGRAERAALRQDQTFAVDVMRHFKLVGIVLTAAGTFGFFVLQT